MSNLALWSRSAWDTDRWLRDFFGPAALDWYKPVTSDFNPAAEVVKDGDDAVVRLELPGSTWRRTSTSSWTGAAWSSTANTATNTRKTRTDAPARDPLWILPPVLPVARARHRRGGFGFL